MYKKLQSFELRFQGNFGANVKNNFLMGVVASRFTETMKVHFKIYESKEPGQSHNQV